MSKPCVRITMRYLNTRYLIVLKLLFLLLAVEDAFESVDIALQNSLCGRREHTFFHKKNPIFLFVFFSFQILHECVAWHCCNIFK